MMHHLLNFDVYRANAYSVQYSIRLPRSLCSNHHARGCLVISTRNSECMHPSTEMLPNPAVNAQDPKTVGPNAVGP